MIRPENTDFIRGVLASDVLTFTRYFFKAQFGRKFIVGKHHVAIANALGEVLRGECTRLIVNVPPRYGKTELVVKNFIAMGLALNPAAKFLHLSYSATLAEDNSVSVKDILNLDAYKRLFPATRIKEGADTKTKWATTAGGGVYATSTLGQITGFGAGIVDSESNGYQFGGAVIIDDPIKPEDALSDLQRAAVNRRFETTMRNRVNSRNTPFVIIMQRLHDDDLCGYLQRTEPNVWDVVKLPALDDTGVALWPFKHTAEELAALRELNPYVFSTQYQQDPQPIEGLLYDPQAWREYTEIPATASAVVKNYTDTADTGGDFLVSIDYVETEAANYVKNVLCTKAAMEETETLVAGMLTRDAVSVANIESNNGGRGFARNVERQLRLMGNAETRVEWFHQGANKQSRIFNNARAVQNLTVWPKGWRTLFPQVAQMLDGYMRVGNNPHDDVPDALTGTVEKRASVSFPIYEGKATGDAYAVIACEAGRVCHLLAYVAGGFCRVAEAGEGMPEDDALQEWRICRVLFAGGREDVAVYNRIKAVLPDVYGCKLPSDDERWRGVWGKFLWRGGSAAQTLFAREAGEGGNVKSKALAVLAEAVAKMLL